MTLLIGSRGWIGAAISARSAVTPLAASQVLALPRAELARIVGRHPVVINAAGSRERDTAQLKRWNVDLVAALVSAAAATGTFLIHLGSAAEYGLRRKGDCWPETATAQPVSDYGHSKLAATQEVLREGGCVLRPFNVFDAEIQPASPLADIAGRIRAGMTAARDVEVMNAATTRDWVSRGFIADSVLAAVALTTPGLFNLCSGVPVTMGEIIGGYLVATEAPVGLTNLASVPANTVVGCPKAWTATSGLTARGGAQDVVAALVNSMTDPHLRAGTDQSGKVGP
ncbi:MAG: NAD-dependent epimerase/dehydratase family protein [Candidatus Nanopelagicales bacterium]